MDKKHSFRIFIIAFAILMSFQLLYSQEDTKPVPYGGYQLMRDFICDEMIYPEEALDNKIEGIVMVTVTVLQDGKTVNYRISEAVSPVIDEEAMRISKLIMFYPALKSSKYIIDDFKIPIKFNIKKYLRNCKKKGYHNSTASVGPSDSSLIVYAAKSLDLRPVPVFEDASMNFSKYIMENLRYPDAAYTQNIEGNVELNFVVETSGRLSNFEIVSPLGGGCTEEAILLLRRIKWKPGIRKDKAVRSFMTANISFSLDNDSNHKYLPNNNNTTM